MQDMNQMHPLLSQWASSEQCLSKGLQAIGIASASCVEAQKSLIDGYKTDVAVVRSHLVFWVYWEISVLKLKIFLAAARIWVVYWISQSQPES